MVFPLAAIGAGIGQFAQDYRQQQESALRQMAAEFQLNLLRQKQQDEQLLGAAVLGGNIPGFGPMNIPGQQQPITGLPQQASAPGGPQAMPSPASPQQQQVPAGMMRTPTGGVVPRGDYLTPEEDTGPATPSPDMSIAPGMTGPGGAISLEPPGGEPSPAPAAQGGAIPLDETTPTAVGAPTPAAATGAEAAPAPASGSIDTPNEFSQYLGMFRQADPSAIAQHIKSVRPGADEGAVWRATATLMKMASGNVREQLGAASMMKFLLGEQGRTTRANIASGDRAAARDLRGQIATGSVDGQQTVAAKNAQTSAGNLAARQQAQAALQEYRRAREGGIQSRFDVRMAERVTAGAPKAAADAVKLMMRRHGVIKSQIDVIDMSMDAAKPETKKKREQLFREMQDLEGRIDARVQAIENGTPVGESE